MSFNSLMFLYFFSFIAVAYYLIPYQYRWAFLLVASCYFYISFSAEYFLLILFLILINYLSAIAIEKSGLRNRKTILFVSILANIGILCSFKYSSLMSESYTFVFGQHQNLGDFLILPMGLSYITLQSIGYIVDVYNGRQQAEKNIGILALFFLFFPKITAGPIERPVNLIPQFRRHHDFNYTRVANGLKFMAWGFFKKIIIADSLVLIVDPVFKNPYDYSGISLLIATLAFTFQIYFDFSGYSDIALGTAQVIGINLTNNFRNPYFAGSISEFWQRWHISLSSWLRDYVFFPLRRYLVKNKQNQILSIIAASMTTMLVCGFWHGTGVTFIVWGLLHGLFISISPLVNSLQRNKSNRRSPLWEKIRHLILMVPTFFLVSFSWIFFRANTLLDAVFIVSNILNTLKISALKAILLNQSSDTLSLVMAQLPYIQVFVLPLFVFIAFGVEYLREKGDFLENLSNKPLLVRWAIYIVVVTTLIVFGAHGFSKTSRFIYFKF